jgi:hypothetical protein
MSKKQKDTSKTDIATIHELAEKFVQTTVVEKFEQDNVSLAQEIINLKQQLSEKTKHIQHLEDILKHTVSSYSPVFNEVTDEEMIALKQLERLKEAAQIRPLSLEEVRIYDLLVKNKRLAQGKETGIIDTVKLPQDKKELIKIAAKKIQVVDQDE